MIALKPISNIKWSISNINLFFRSIVIQSETGSGKTLTYAVPVVNALEKGRLTADNRCIVIAPTKELCTQIYKYV